MIGFGSCCQKFIVVALYKIVPETQTAWRFALFTYINYPLITLIAVACYYSIRGLRSKNRISDRAYRTLVFIGPISWFAQMLLLLLMGENATYLIAAAAIIAGICFWFLKEAAADRNINGSNAAQAMLWGQLVFPLVLIALLPNGLWTLLALFN